MSDLHYSLTGDRKAGLLFDDFPETARPYLHTAIDELIGQLYAAVSAAIPRATGKLAAELARYVDDLAAGVRGSVVVNAKGDVNLIRKALSLEYGAHGQASVGAHLSTLDHIFSRIMSPVQVVVEAYTRTVNIEEVDFLRGPMRAIADQASARLKEALDQAAAEAVA